MKRHIIIAGAMLLCVIASIVIACKSMEWESTGSFHVAETPAEMERRDRQREASAKEDIALPDVENKNAAEAANAQ